MNIQKPQLKKYGQSTKYQMNPFWPV